ncbi:MAG TPA: hypothetical protein VLM19_00705 [Nitrospiraceae bacterium]|nr:hypothetical protein [Nitrospiraceae bacterium]
MSRTDTYKNYTTRSTPLQIHDSMQWTLSIVIEWERDGQVTGRPFSAQSIYQTEAEADLHGFTYGQRIIDGQVPGFSLD